MKRLLAVLIPIVFLGTGSIAADTKAPWRLTFRHGPLDVITINYKNGDARSYMYMRFTLENKSETDATLGGVHFKAIVGTNPRKRKTHVAAPQAEAEESVRRLSRISDLKNVIQIQKMKTLAAGKSVQGIAVLGTWNREWDVTTIHVSGLESGAVTTRVKKYGDLFTVAHRAYYHRNRRVAEKVSDIADFQEVRAIVKHNVVWSMVYSRKGDEFGAQNDPFIFESEGWDVLSSEIAYEKK